MRKNENQLNDGFGVACVRASQLIVRVYILQNRSDSIYRYYETLMYVHTPDLRITGGWIPMYVKGDKGLIDTCKAFKRKKYIWIPPMDLSGTLCVYVLLTSYVLTHKKIMCEILLHVRAKTPGRRSLLGQKLCNLSCSFVSGQCCFEVLMFSLYRGKPHFGPDL